MKPVTPQEIESACGPSVWDLGNRVLYDLCRKNPTHTSEDCVIAKIWLIGRSYSAAIERRRAGNRNGDDFYESVVAGAIKSSRIDKWISNSRNVAAGHPRTIATHKEVTALFFEIANLEKRSLASKYLHFHLPREFFIYDSRASAAIKKLVPRLNKLPDINAEKCDKEYKDFVRRCVWLRDEIERAHGILLNPRQLDKLLLLAGK